MKTLPRLRAGSQIEWKTIPSRNLSLSVRPNSSVLLTMEQDERLETGISVGDLQSVTGANDSDRQHSGGVDEFKRSIDRIAADKLLFWMALLPLALRDQGESFLAVHDNGK